jgi:hypothetical protein
MKEFIFEDKTKNLVDLIGYPRTKKCFVVLNAELGTTYSSGAALSSYPKLSRPSNSSIVRDNVVKDTLIRGINKL